MGRNKQLRKVESCGLFWTGESEPFALIAKTLKGNGVRVGKVDRDHNRIIAKMTPCSNSGSCKVTLQLFPQVDVCLVVATLETLRGKDEGAVLDCLRKLKSCLDNVRLVDEQGVLDWKRRELQRVLAGERDADTVAFTREIGAGNT